MAGTSACEYVACESLAGWRADVAPGVVQLDPARGLLSFFKVTGPGKEHEHEAKQYAFPEPIPMTGGALTPGAGIDPGPLWTAALRCQNPMSGVRFHGRRWP